MTQGALRPKPAGTGWISVSREAPYFLEDNGRPWTPIGQNDAITWPELSGLFRRREPASAERYIRVLADHGVSCLRLMLEYSQTKHRYFERRPGEYNRTMVQLWDDLLDICRSHELRVLLTPFDTFWMWNKWKYHPYNRANGGPCTSRNRWMLCSDTRKLIKDRLDYATDRWGGDGMIFAWDLWNEIHPSHAGNSAEPIFEFLEDVSTHLRRTEQRLHGAAHLQTASVFTPAFALDSRLAEVVYRHPCLDFVNVHLYEEGTIDYPLNTVDAAVSAGRLIAEAVAEAGPARPVFDSEHGPIHTFKDHHKTLPAAFDDEYFRHIQWAHLASGGAGGGMRWPNRHPHSLTPGMRKAQKALADFLPHLDWAKFHRRNITHELQISHRGTVAFGCGGTSQALLYLLRRDSIKGNGMLDGRAAPVSAEVKIPGLRPGAYKIVCWDTISGQVTSEREVAHFSPDYLPISTSAFSMELAVAVRNHRL